MDGDQAALSLCWQPVSGLLLKRTKECCERGGVGGLPVVWWPDDHRLLTPEAHNVREKPHKPGEMDPHLLSPSQKSPVGRVQGRYPRRNRPASEVDPMDPTSWAGHPQAGKAPHPTLQRGWGAHWWVGPSAWAHTAAALSECEEGHVLVHACMEQKDCAPSGWRPRPPTRHSLPPVNNKKMGGS